MPSHIVILAALAMGLEGSWTSLKRIGALTFPIYPILTTRSLRPLWQIDKGLTKNQWLPHHPQQPWWTKTLVLEWGLFAIHHAQPHGGWRSRHHLPLVLSPFDRFLGCLNLLNSPGCPQLPFAQSSEVTEMNPVMGAWPSGWLCCKSLLLEHQAWLPRWSSRYEAGQPPQEDLG